VALLACAVGCSRCLQHIHNPQSPQPKFVPNSIGEGQDGGERSAAVTPTQTLPQQGGWQVLGVPAGNLPPLVNRQGEEDLPEAGAKL
jgi:hypothetical protein